MFMSEHELVLSDWTFQKFICKRLKHLIEVVFVLQTAVDICGPNQWDTLHVTSVRMGVDVVPLFYHSIRVKGKGYGPSN